jgi:CO/xanthine dehydrogenase FAD-binding subunit
VEILLPRSLDEALAMKAERPGALPIAGGTDVMVELNFDRLRPEVILDLTRVPELRRWSREDDGAIFLGAGVTFSEIMRELPEATALVQASRTVGSPQIRNRGTVGGNLGTASPAGDALPVLAAYEADVVVTDQEAERSLPWHEFLIGVKRTALTDRELIVGARWRLPTGPGSFSKIGTRNAMVISVAGLCLQVDEDARRVRVALGSVAPTILRAGSAETRATEVLASAGAWDDPAAQVDHRAIEEFAELVAEDASPIDDVRGSAAYRRHAVKVVAARALRWALDDRRPEAAA